MSALSSPDRKRLEAQVLAARRAAEGASRAAVEALGVFLDRRPDYLDAKQAALRNGLRAKWRQLGGDRELLVAECAYEQWHRLLFARFLAENKLLLHPSFKAPVSLAECDELAAELGEPDAWSVAARFAAEILPGIFRLDDPCVRLRLPPEGRHSLEQNLDAIPAETFAADDALGWVYQFWQKDKKDEVNASERKIGGADLGPVTQLFTENYMVRFLLENSLGAWWAARHPDSPLVKNYDYLRFDDDGLPAAGSFDGWPDRVAEVSVMDPCCGSGHFLVEAFSMLWQMRAEEEGSSPVDAQDAVLRDNLFGLELDPRCVQIAMFAVALQAWKAGGGWRQLPVPNIACSGIPVKAPVEEWKALAGRDERLENALVRLHILFRDADTLGSLIDPKRATEITDPIVPQTSLEDVDWSDVTPLLKAATSRETTDPATSVLGSEAASISIAAGLLARRYTLVVTNVPYLSRESFAPTLVDFGRKLPDGVDADLAVMMLERSNELCAENGTTALVLTENFLELVGYRKFRERLLATRSMGFIAWLGARAFRSAAIGTRVRVVLVSLTRRIPQAGDVVRRLDVASYSTAEAKGHALTSEATTETPQVAFRKNPDARIIATDIPDGRLLSEYAESSRGICTGDYNRFGRLFWEFGRLPSGWVYQQSSPDGSAPWTGMSNVLLWESGQGQLTEFVARRLGTPSIGAWVRGLQFQGRAGVAIMQAGNLRVGLYMGDLFDDNTVVLVPKAHRDLPALYRFAESGTLENLVRRIEGNLRVADKTMLKVPFDVAHWRRVADEAGPLPEPFSDDPTQWLFAGRPEASTAPLQVAVARLVGYRWPEQEDPDHLDAYADVDGIVCLPSVAGEPPAADRVQQLLAAAYGKSWSPTRVRELLDQAGSKKNSVADWLRDEFFKQHCALFGNRPFVWHVWDGLRGGFSALVNYHRLDRKMLEKLTYTYLGQDWVERQRAGVRDEVTGAEARLAAALELQRKLELVIDGEKPFDIFVRWKELHEQPVGWVPDVNDGVRLNVRPFVEAGVLRTPFNIHWKKDRGKNLDGTERDNDKQLTLATKLEARKGVGRP